MTMAYLLFPSEEAAVAAEALITGNCRAFIQQAAPERLSPDGELICVNAATGQLDPSAQGVERWAIPQQYAEGWAIPMPEPQQIAPMPMEVFAAGVGGTLVDGVTLPQPAPTLERARDDSGRFIPDDPATPDADEAWVEVEG